MIASILTIGDELLIGQVIDTNSAFIAENLNMQGISIKRILSVSDNLEAIISGLDICSDTDLIIATGGLGPTRDDITKEAMCVFFNTQLSLNNEVLRDVERFIVSRGQKIMNINNRLQANVPESAKILRNINGTAPGLWFEKNNSIYVFLPGVPYEMKNLLVKEVLPNINRGLTSSQIIHRTIHTIGSFEANLAEILDNWVNQLPNNIKVAFLPSAGIIRIRLSGFGNDKSSLEKAIEIEIEKLLNIIPDLVFSTNTESLEEVVGNLLKKTKKKLAVAESCSGGSLAATITSIPGCSEYFNGGIIAYSNEIKINQLRVKEDDIVKYGAVSETVVEQMAENMKRIFNVDYAIATSGIAGPSGATNDKPIGTTCIAVAGPQKTIKETYVFGDNRILNIRKTVLTGLNILRKMLIDDELDKV